MYYDEYEPTPTKFKNKFAQEIYRLAMDTHRPHLIDVAYYIDDLERDRDYYKKTHEEFLNKTLKQGQTLTTNILKLSLAGVFKESITEEESKKNK